MLAAIGVIALSTVAKDGGIDIGGGTCVAVEMGETIMMD